MKFEEIPKDKWQKLDSKPPIKVFYNKKFLVQIIDDNGNIRITVNRTEIQHYKKDTTAQWKDGISWDDLQEIKNSLGFERTWMVEIYPPEDRVVNVANMRHLWLLDEPPKYGW